MDTNVLYYGDNLDVLRRHVKDETVDLVYLDPPFNSDADYNVLFAEHGTKAAAQVQAFTDTWEWNTVAAAAYEEVVESGGRVADTMRAFRTMLGTSDMLAYLSMMAPRLIELRRVLKPTGGLYLHCDPTASHYLKLLLDAVFDPRNFRNEVVWRRSNAHNKLSRQYGPIHDTLLFYAKSNETRVNPGRRPYMRKYIESRFVFEDSRGRYQLNYLTAPGIRRGQGGAPWAGFDPTAHARNWAIPRSLRQYLPPGTSTDTMSTQEQLDALLAQDLIHLPKKAGGQPMYKQYVGDGTPYQDVWAYQPHTQGSLVGTEEAIDEDVKWLDQEDEKLGYPTQKPSGLIKRMLRSAVPSTGVLLDPFCGCGTAIDAAQELGWSWIGIDVTHLSIGLIKHRLAGRFGPEIARTYRVVGEPTTVDDARVLAGEDPFQFQAWALGLVGARIAGSEKKGGDKGIDGRLYFHLGDGKTRQIVLSVKAGNMVPAFVDALWGVVERESAEIGVLISFNEPTAGMRARAAEAGFYASPWGKHPRIQLRTIAELLAGKGIDYPRVAGANVTLRSPQRRRANPAETLKLFSELMSQSDAVTGEGGDLDDDPILRLIPVADRPAAFQLAPSDERAARGRYYLMTWALSRSAPYAWSIAMTASLDQIKATLADISDEAILDGLKRAQTDFGSTG